VFVMLGANFDINRPRVFCTAFDLSLTQTDKGLY